MFRGVGITAGSLGTFRGEAHSSRVPIANNPEHVRYIINQKVMSTTFRKKVDPPAEHESACIPVHYSQFSA